MGKWAPARSLQVVLGGRRRSAVDAKEVMEEPEAIKAAKRLVSQLVNLGFMNCNLSKVLCILSKTNIERLRPLKSVVYISKNEDLETPTFLSLSLSLAWRKSD